MLQQLYIRHLLLIKQVQIDLHGGLNILSGESGAGKSLVLQAVALLLGARFDKDLLSSGEKTGSVIGLWKFAVDHPVWQQLEALGVPYDVEEAVFIRRQFGQNAGVFINDTPVQLRSLSQLGVLIAEMYGQFAAHRLAEADYQRRLLDDFGGLGALVGKASQSFSAYTEAKEALASAQERYDSLLERADYVEHVLAELEALDLSENELTDLQEQRQQARLVAVRQETISQALRGLEKSGAVRHLDQVQSGLISSDDESLSEAIEGIERARIELVEVERTLSALSAEVEFSEMDLDSIEERLFRISELARKHRVAPENLFSVQEDLARESHEIEQTGKEIVRLQGVLQQSEDRVQSDHATLSAARDKNAQIFSKIINQEFPHLNMPHAKLTWQIEALAAPTITGSDRVQLLLQTQKGAEPKPLLKVASGGELSRVLLAIALCMGQGKSQETNGIILVFDEIDAGMGGETAAALGGRLQALAAHRQVLAVTHSPQMAARAEAHLGVRKITEGDQLITQVARLEGEARREEIARMLAGETVTKAARTAADALIEESMS